MNDIARRVVEATEEKKRYEQYVNTPGKLSIKSFRTDLPFNVNRGMAGFQIRDLINKDYYELDFDVYLPSKKMNLQRPLVWDTKQKKSLIESIMKGIYIPSITVIQHENEGDKKRILRIIDGKQRLTTVISFYNGEFGIDFGGKEWFFNDLSDQAKRLVDDCFRVDIGYSYYDKPITDEWMIKWFEMINFAGTPQDIEHLNNLKK
jgi:hypothetical protein